MTESPSGTLRPTMGGCTLAAILAGKSLSFSEPGRLVSREAIQTAYVAEQTHEANMEVPKNLRLVLGTIRLRDITPKAIEQYLEQRLNASRGIVTKLGTQYRGKLKRRETATC